MKKAKIFAFIILLSLLISPISANSIEMIGWNTNGVKISTGTEVHQNPQICSNSEGGAIIVWEKVGNNADIIVQKIDINGTIKWQEGGIEICTASGDQENPQICSDGKGGAIIAWEDKRNESITGMDIYMQKIASNGTVQWTENGIRVCTVNYSQHEIQLICDGDGGVVISWQDNRKASDFDIYAQKIDRIGNVLWKPNGTEICTAINDQDYPQICSDNEKGAIITWLDKRNGFNLNIFGQRINSSGKILWVHNGTEICTYNSTKYLHQIIEDGTGGAIITWADNRSVDNDDIYAQKINSSGSIQWNKNGTTICSANNHQDFPQIISNGEGGATITWFDMRDFFSSIYAQLIDSNGNIQWTKDGVPIIMYVAEFDHSICSDGAGGAIITWVDDRNVIWDPIGLYERNIDIYTQKIDKNGVIHWTKSGLAVCTEGGGQSFPQIVSDGAGGAIIAWSDSRVYGFMDSHIYVQRTIIYIGEDTSFPYFIILVLLISLISIAVFITIFVLVSKLRMFEPLKRIFYTFVSLK